MFFIKDAYTPKPNPRYKAPNMVLYPIFIIRK